MDFSWAIILACVREFCGEDIIEYLNRTKRIVNGLATDVNISKPLLHICTPHMMEANKNNIISKYSTDLNKQSQVHFAMRSMGRLINCKSFPEAIKIVNWMQIMMTSEFASVVVIRSLQHLENSINTFEEELDDSVELNKLRESSCIKTEKAVQTVADKEHAVTDKEHFYIDKSKDRDSNMHDFWRAKILEQKNKLQTIPKKKTKKQEFYAKIFLLARGWIALHIAVEQFIPERLKKIQQYL